MRVGMVASVRKALPAGPKGTFGSRISEHPCSMVVLHRFLVKGHPPKAARRAFQSIGGGPDTVQVQFH